MTTNKHAVLVASSVGNKVIFHEKKEEVEHRVSVHEPGCHHLLDKRVREEAYFINGRYSGEKSNKRGMALMKKRVAGILLRTFQSIAQTPIHVNKEQLESFGYQHPKED